MPADPLDDSSSSVDGRVATGEAAGRFRPLPAVSFKRDS
jgi:hypothetical protein